MRKISKTKRQLIFEPLSIMDQLRYRYEQHEKHYGCLPKKIFLSAVQFAEYKKIVPKVAFIMLSVYYNDRIFFRGSEVINIESVISTSK